MCECQITCGDGDGGSIYKALFIYFKVVVVVVVVVCGGYFLCKDAKHKQTQRHAAGYFFVCLVWFCGWLRVHEKAAFVKPNCLYVVVG